MTIQGAIAELQNLLKVDDIPFYYKGGIEKVIETIQMERAEQTEPSCSEIPNSSTTEDCSMVETMSCQECKHWNDTEDGCAERHDCKFEWADCPWK